MKNIIIKKRDLNFVCWSSEKIYKKAKTEKKVAHLEEGSIRQTQEKLYIKCVLSTSNNNNNNNIQKKSLHNNNKMHKSSLKSPNKRQISKGASWGRQHTTYKTQPYSQHILKNWFSRGCPKGLWISFGIFSL